MTLGSRIGALRREQGLTQDALAKALNVSNQAVSKWELDQCCPDISLLPRLADIFDISLDDLFGRARVMDRSSAHASLPWGDDDALHAVLYIGHRLVKEEPLRDKKEIRFIYEGKALNIHSEFSVECQDVAGYVQAGGSITCGAVGKDASAGGAIQCGAVGGNASAGGAVTCGAVGKNASAGGTVNCRDVYGLASAGGNINSNGVIQTAKAEGNITCGDIGGDAIAGNNIRCRSVLGNARADKIEMETQADPSSIFSAPGQIVTESIEGLGDNTLRAVLFKGSQQIKQTPLSDVAEKITIDLCGEVMNIISDFSVHCGDVEGNVTCGGDLTCGDIAGDVTVDGDLECSDIAGDITVTGSITCDSVGGDISAEGNVTCDEVGGDVTAGGNVTCNDVGGDVSAGGDVSCDNVEGSI